MSKICNSCKEDKPLDQYHRHKSHKDGLRSQCIDCRRATRCQNKVTASRANAKLYQRKKEYIKRRAAQWQKNNPSKRAMYNAKRKAHKLRAIFKGDSPEYYNFFMEEIYNLARHRTDATGVPHEVDHIVPLVHYRVCGLHTPCNLQILTKSENSSKSNTFDI